ncbi:hypothetical protein THL1_1567 [Pseudomonas sp. TCU-HL1]|nr:hypothetical protein THL1_1567 [Pseudomonas sp. TCU-HL1]
MNLIPHRINVSVPAAPSERGPSRSAPDGR